MALQDFADFIPHIAIEDGLALGAGRWESEARAALSTHGAVLLRGPVFREDGVEVALEVIDEELLDDAFWSTPRSKVGGKTLTATEYPSPRTIQPHSEMAYMSTWPRYVAFHSLVVAEEGGETTICSVDKVTEALGDRILPFAEKGVLYRRTFQQGVDIPWQKAFQTDDRADVEEVAQRNGMSIEWLDVTPSSRRIARRARSRARTGNRFISARRTCSMKARSIPTRATRSLSFSAATGCRARLSTAMAHRYPMRTYRPCATHSTSR